MIASRSAGASPGIVCTCVRIAEAVLSELNLTNTIDVLSRGLEEQQPELARELHEQGIRRDGNVVTLMRMADIAEATQRNDIKSSPPSAGNNLGAHLRLSPLLLDGEDHRSYRRLLDPLFAPRAVNRLEVLQERLPDYAIDPDKPPSYKNNGGVRTVEPLHLVFTPGRRP
jgi:cytochrome P450